MDSLRCSKRPRLEKDSGQSLTSDNSRTNNKESSSSMVTSVEQLSIFELVERGFWNEATERAIECPQEVLDSPNPSPLAVACRTGAPFECIKALLQADPQRIRHLLDSRGTPLHEAIVCETTGADAIEALLRVDESLGSDTTRATLLQDVDGFVPLHLLIRRRFQSHILSLDEDMSLMEILEMLVMSCPEAVTIPDRGEYEEPPIVYALKANIYAPSLGSEESTLTRVERQIFEMVQTMLKHAPFAAACVFSGFRGQYTALHSAVFHGRYTTTVDLILKTEAQFAGTEKAALLANTQGELPLHFCAMRGERPRTVATLAKAAPQAVINRDASGLTPFHWVWIRFISTLMALDEDGRGLTLSLNASRNIPAEANRYNEFAFIEQGDFDTDLHLIRRLDPPVDFLRMRHIPNEVTGEETSLEWAERSSMILKYIRDRHYSQRNTEDSDITLSRQESVVSLFWTKVVSLLEAAKEAATDQPCGDSILVHTAFASSCCLPPVAYLVSSLYPEELTIRDNRGRLPLHYAACRPWHNWDLGAYEHTASRMLYKESLETLRIAIRVSPAQAARVTDNDKKLVLHHTIDTLVKAFSRSPRSIEDNGKADALEIVRILLSLNPESLQRRDGSSKLYPFLQATATATEEQSHLHDELSLTLTYELLRENPSLLNSSKR